MLNLRTRETPSITFFAVSQEGMVNVCVDLERIALQSQRPCLE